MATATGRQVINGIDVPALRDYIESCISDPNRADRNPEVIARWVGGTRAEVVSPLGGPPVYMGGDEDPSALGMLLRTLVACDIEVVVNACSLLGVEIDELSIEAQGHANVGRYLGIGSADGPGYRSASYVIHLKTKGGASEELIEAIRRAVAEGSPVGDTLERHVELNMDLDIS